MKNVMKKVLAPTLAAVMALSMSATAFAEKTGEGTYSYTGTNAFDETAQTAVTYTAEYSYIVTIPATITLGSTATITVNELHCNFQGCGFEIALVDATLASDSSGAFVVKNSDDPTDVDYEELKYTITGEIPVYQDESGSWLDVKTYANKEIKVDDTIIDISHAEGVVDPNDEYGESKYSTTLTFSEPLSEPDYAGDYKGTLTFELGIYK